MGGGDDQLQPEDEDGKKHTEVLVSTDRVETQIEDVMLKSIQSMWGEKLPCDWIPVDDPIPADGRVLGVWHLPHSRDPVERLGDEQLQQGEDDNIMMNNFQQETFLIPAYLFGGTTPTRRPQPTWPSHTNLINKVVVAIRNCYSYRCMWSPVYYSYY